MTDKECIEFIQEAIETYMSIGVWSLTSRNEREIQDCFDRMKERLLKMIDKNHKIVEKKILPQYFQHVWDGKKTFELRKDEDNIKVGDFILLKEWDGKKYTGSAILKRVCYVLRSCPQYGLMDGYCIIGLTDYENEETRQD